MNNMAEIISVKYSIVVPNTSVNPVLLLWQFLIECAFHKLTGNGQSRKIGGGEKRYPLLPVVRQLKSKSTTFLMFFPACDSSTV